MRGRTLTRRMVRRLVFYLQLTGSRLSEVPGMSPSVLPSNADQVGG